ncbi:hypothetical protein C8N35_1096 [Breoghania corrubedonensis]|uniref:Uncharacterized protein n=2 Tax=Breoghania corrubedonensis TaxID=665038 RepID=A0A2T5V4L3_9HYPH|nr:hypothetical protein C8N35_1096 [Breoghania corrubedonensis]
MAAFAMSPAVAAAGLGDVYLECGNGERQSVAGKYRVPTEAI